MEILKKELSRLGIELSQEQTVQFEKYMEKILEWNQHVNLTAITDREEFVQKHFVDSVLIAERKEMLEADKIVDVGTGAGFPGVPLAIIFPEKSFLLMDSLNKRLKIIREICEEIGIENTAVLHMRAEEMGQNKEHREKYDLCVSRAVANLSTLSEYCLPLVKEGGYFMAYKGPEAENEIKNAGKAPSVLGGELVDIFRPQSEQFKLEHNILVFKKKKKTPVKYPRKAGTPAKEPLK